MPSFERTAAERAGQDASQPPIAARAPGAEADELAALLQRIGLGERDALRTLYACCGAKLFGLALRILVRRD